MQVPLFDLKEQYLGLEAEITEELLPFLRQQHFILGPAVEKFETALAAYCEVPHVLGVSSGTDALLLAMEAIGVGPGDEVIVPAFTFYATASCVVRRGARPVFVDVGLDDFNAIPQAVINAITSKTKAIIPVHLFGQCADMDPIVHAACDKGISVIEDAAQAIGAEYKGKKAGTFGRFGAFSFFPTKNLGGFGDGGALTAHTKEDFEKVKCLRMHGSKVIYEHEEIGGCFRLDALQALILEIKLKKLEGWNTLREHNAAYYTKHLKDVGDIITPKIDQHRRHIFHQYVIRTEKRDALKAFLAERGIGTNIYYPATIPAQKSMEYLKHKNGEFPNSEKAAKEVLALPIFPELTKAQLAKVVQGIKEFFDK